MALCSPNNEPALNLLSELRDISSALEVDSLPAARIEDVQRKLAKGRYDVFHYSGHYSKDGAFFHGEGDRAQIVPSFAFAKIVSAARPLPKCVVLNGCDSCEGVSLFTEKISYTIAMEGKIEDLTAIEFSRFFYSGISDPNIPFPRAFESARLLLDAYALPGRQLPVLLRRGDKCSQVVTSNHPSDSIHRLQGDAAREPSLFRFFLENTVSSATPMERAGYEALIAELKHVDAIDDILITSNHARSIVVTAKRGTLRQYGGPHRQSITLTDDVLLIYALPRPLKHSALNVALKFSIERAAVALLVNGRPIAHLDLSLFFAPR